MYLWSWNLNWAGWLVEQTRVRAASPHPRNKALKACYVLLSFASALKLYFRLIPSPLPVINTTPKPSYGLYNWPDMFCAVLSWLQWVTTMSASLATPPPATTRSESVASRTTSSTAALRPSKSLTKMAAKLTATWAWATCSKFYRVMWNCNIFVFDDIRAYMHIHARRPQSDSVNEADESGNYRREVSTTMLLFPRRSR